jgi:hypothetical protein
MSLPPPLTNPYRPSDAVVVPRTVAPERARDVAERRIKGRWLRPADGNLLTTIAPPRLVWVPYWRLAVSLSGKMIVSYGENSSRPEGWIIEQHEDGLRKGGLAAIPMDGITGYAMICARKSPELASWFQSCETTSAPLWHVRSDELIPFELAGAALGPDPTIVESDLFPGDVHPRARRLCVDGLQKAQAPGVTVWKPPHVETVITHFVLVPHYWISYEYRGEASPGQTEGFFVAVHGRSGRNVGESHPSTLRAVVGRLRRLLSLDPSALR